MYMKYYKYHGGRFYWFYQEKKNDLQQVTDKSFHVKLVHLMSGNRHCKNKLYGNEMMTILYFVGFYRASSSLKQQSVGRLRHIILLLGPTVFVVTP
jgi:hypothetical protein